MSTCGQCGAENAAHAKFCGVCGAATTTAGSGASQSDPWWTSAGQTTPTPVPAPNWPTSVDVEQAATPPDDRREPTESAIPTAGGRDAPGRVIAAESVPRHSSRRNVVIFAVVVVVVLGAAGFGGFFVLSNTKNTNSPPTSVAPGPTDDGSAVAMLRVTDLLIDEARSDLVSAGLPAARIHVVKTPTGERPPGTVLGQDPPVGASVDGKQTVTLTIASYPTKMPDLVGLGVDNARAALEKIGIDPAIDDVLDDLDHPKPSGTVLVQNTPAGSPFSAHVVLSIATAPVTTALSDVPVDDTQTQPTPDSPTIGGQSFPDGVTWTVSGCSATPQTTTTIYDLALGYRILRFTAGLTDDSEPGVAVRATLTLDGSAQTPFVLSTTPQTFTIDVTGRRTLQIDLSATGDPDTCPSATAAFGAAHLYALPQDSPTTTTTVP